MAIDRGQGIAVTQKLAASYDVGSLVEDAEASRDAAAVSAGEALASKITAVEKAILAGDSEAVATQAEADALLHVQAAAGFKADTEGFRNEAEGFKDEAEGFKDDAETAATSFPDWTQDQGTTDIHSGNYTDTVYTHPATHSISEVSGLQAALDNKVDDGQVLTDVPSGALFTDTINTLALGTTSTTALAGDTAIPTALANIEDFTIGTGVEVNTALTIDDTKVPKVFVQTSTPAQADSSPGDLWWDTDGYSMYVAHAITSSFVVWYYT